MKHLALMIALMLSSLFTLVPQAGAQAPAGRAGEEIRGLWVWRQQWIENADERAALLAFSERYGFNRLLVQIHFDVRDGRPELRIPEPLRALVTDAAALGIRVEALDGAKDMAMKANWPRTLAALDAILAFNETLPADAKLAGMHYDIEPYIMDAWKAGDESRQPIMLDLLHFYAQARERIAEKGGQGFTLAADIPFWYDNKTEPGDSCIVTFNGQTKNLHEHIQDLCDYVGIMSYRRKATGGNSVVSVSQNEVDYAAKIGKFITPALETIELKDVPQITFYGSTPEMFWGVYDEVRDTLRDHPGYGGILVHSYRGARELLADSPARPE